MEIGNRSGARAGWLLCLLLFAGGAAGVQAVAGEVPAQQQAIGRSAYPEKKASGSRVAEPGLAKVFTTRYPRRTDIPDAFLVVMLALIGVVVISRRGVTEKERTSPPEGIDE